MKLPTFELDGKTYRFARLTRLERDAYDYKSEEHYNIVQQKRWWGWKTVEEEHVPAFAWIAKATLGSTDWKSEMIARWKEKMQ
jgi:hypothetical protein